jgi:hypothetical protein
MLDAARLSVLEMRAFLDGAGGVEFGAGDRAARWGLIARVLEARAYPGLGRGDKGVVRRRRRYRADDYWTPFQKLQSLPEREQYLRPGVTPLSLQRQAGR